MNYPPLENSKTSAAITVLVGEVASLIAELRNAYQKHADDGADLDSIRAECERLRAECEWVQTSERMPPEGTMVSVLRREKRSETGWAHGHSMWVNGGNTWTSDDRGFAKQYPYWRSMGELPDAAMWKRKNGNGNPR